MIVRKRIAQQRAEFAFNAVTNAKDRLNGDSAKSYKSYVKKVPMLVKTNGLAAALTFVFSKSGGNHTPYGLVLEQVREWLSKNNNELLELYNDDSNSLIQQILKLNGKSYRTITLEVMALFTWLKRFADGMIDGESSEN